MYEVTGEPLSMCPSVTGTCIVHTEKQLRLSGLRVESVMDEQKDINVGRAASIFSVSAAKIETKLSAIVCSSSIQRLTISRLSMVVWLSGRVLT